MAEKKITYTNGVNDMKKQYTKYIKNHIENVQLCYKKAVVAFRVVFPEVYEDLDQIKTLSNLLDNHDASKFSEEEFFPYAMRFFPIKGIDPKEEYIKNNFKLAWLHHVNNNGHHPGHWALVDDNEVQIFDMPDVYIIEMLCDWMAMSIYYNSSTKEYWESPSAQKLPMSEYTRSKVEKFMAEMDERSDFVW